MSEEQEREHGALVLKWARRIWGNGKARSWSHAIDLAATYAAPSQEKPKGKGKAKTT